uniref:Insulin-like domain-containing protein n=1 Tax=Periophthalmus magnuspinnatus TaxID=409849 RepID=A0A3B3ZUX6_9GOBI
MAVSWLQRVCLLMALFVLVAGEPQVLCGADLVDAIQFVCGERRVYPSSHDAATQSQRRQKRKEIVDTCCHRECSLEILEQLCKL